MILVFEKTPLNEKAVRVLTQNNQQKVVYFFEKNASSLDKHLSILDLETQGNFQESLNGELLAEQITKSGVNLSNITSIDLLVSDIYSKEPSLPQLAAELAIGLQDAYSHSVTIRIISDPNHLSTHLVPPNNDQDAWTVYGINSNKVKKELWSGKNLDEWLNDPQRVFAKRVEGMKIGF